ncbi:unnamed protein product [Lactuca saligna]|uniref:Uncharacterized protein n=1 Tax=Lactuca saligna TaxID=75948 RepID=A0AA36E063_LACSI|nr:unnamed protein product [Lactuca saligna]
MDVLSSRIAKVKVLHVQLTNSNLQIDELKYEKAVMKSCIADANCYLSNLIEMHDSLLMVNVRQHLAKKLKPVLAMLNRLEGASESISLSKEGFIKVMNVMLTDNGADHLLLSLYLKHMRPQYET